MNIFRYVFQIIQISKKKKSIYYKKGMGRYISVENRDAQKKKEMLEPRSMAAVVARVWDFVCRIQ